MVKSIFAGIGFAFVGYHVYRFGKQHALRAATAEELEAQLAVKRAEASKKA